MTIVVLFVALALGVRPHVVALGTGIRVKMADNWSIEDVAAAMASNPDLARVNTVGRPSPPKTEQGQSLINAPRTKGATRNKYGVAPKEDRIYNGVLYASKKEAKFAAELDLRKKAGDISFWLRQVPFALPGGSVYRLDFMAFTRLDDEAAWLVDYIEVKGRDLPMGKLKRHQTEEIYHISIRVV